MDLIQDTVDKSRFWAALAQQALNDRQRQLVRRLLDAGDGGFLGGLNVEKYLKMTKTSKATATRDLSDLVQRGLLHTSGLGKAVRYYLSVPGWRHGREEDLQA
jgi:Fic family protein